MSAQADARFADEQYLRDIYGNPRMLDALRPLGIIGGIRGKGLMIGVELVEDPATKKPFAPEVKLGLRIGKQALTNGLLIRYDSLWITFGSPLIVGEAGIDQMVAILEQSIREVPSEI